MYFILCIYVLNVLELGFSPFTQSTPAFEKAASIEQV